jgi:hypothetical protein
VNDIIAQMPADETITTVKVSAASTPAAICLIQCSRRSAWSALRFDQRGGPLPRMDMANVTVDGKPCCRKLIRGPAAAIPLSELRWQILPYSKCRPKQESHSEADLRDHEHGPNCRHGQS